MSEEKKTLGIFSDPMGDVSSKRISSVALIVTGIGLAIFCVITKRWEGWNIIYGLIGAGLALQGVTAWSERKLP